MRRDGLSNTVHVYVCKMYITVTNHIKLFKSYHFKIPLVCLNRWRLEMGAGLSK